VFQKYANSFAMGKLMEPSDAYRSSGSSSAALRGLGKWLAKGHKA